MALLEIGDLDGAAEQLRGDARRGWILVTEANRGAPAAARSTRTEPVDRDDASEPADDASRRSRFQPVPEPPHVGRRGGDVLEHVAGDGRRGQLRGRSLGQSSPNAARGRMVQDLEDVAPGFDRGPSARRRLRNPRWAASERWVRPALGRRPSARRLAQQANRYARPQAQRMSRSSRPTRWRS